MPEPLRLSRRVRVAIVYRVCERYRARTFSRLNEHPDIDVTLLHGKSIPGSKLINAPDLSGFRSVEMATLHGAFTAGGRTTISVVSPTVAWHLFRLRPDVVLAEGGSNVLTNVFVFAFTKITRTPIIWWTLGQLPDREYRGIRRLYRWVVGAMERQATALLGYSSRATAYFAHMGYPSEKAFVSVNTVVDGPLRLSRGAGRQTLRELQPEVAWGSKFIVLFVGVLEREKRVDRLIQAFKTAFEPSEQCHLVIVGGGPEQEAISELVSRLGMANSVTLLGPQYDRVGAIFDAADVFVLPGLGGRAISEAMGHGLPVICARADGTELDFVRSGYSGFRVDGDNDEIVIDHFSRYLRVLRDDPALRSRLGSNAEKLAVNELNMDSAIDGIVSAIAYTAHRSHP